MFDKAVFTAILTKDTIIEKDFRADRPNFTL